jgi:hypothetical protein
MRRTALSLAVLVSLAGMASPAMGQSRTRPIALDPQTVKIGMTFDGVMIEVSAEVPSGYEAAVRLMGRPERQELVKLGKKAGLLWMGVGAITLETMPRVFQVLTSAPLAEAASPTALASWSLGYAYLVPDRVLDAAMRAEFVGLKEHEGLFAIHEGGLARTVSAASPTGAVPKGADAQAKPATAQKSETELLHGTFRLPAGVRAGDYAVELIGFKDRRAVHLGSTTLRLEYVGVARALRHLAFDHGLAYGIAASLIAIVVGLLTGFLFRPKADESH